MSQTPIYQAVERAKAYRFIKYALGGSRVPYPELLADLIRVQRLRTLCVPFREEAAPALVHKRPGLVALHRSRQAFAGETDPRLAADLLDRLNAAATPEDQIKLLLEQVRQVDPAAEPAFRKVAERAAPDETPEDARRFLEQSEGLLHPLAADPGEPGAALYRIASRTLAYCARATPGWRSSGISLADLVPEIFHEQCQYFFEKCDSVPPALRVARLAPVVGLSPAPGVYFASTVAKHLVSHLSLPLKAMRRECPRVRDVGDEALEPAVRVALEAATYAQRHGMDLWEWR